MPSFRTQFQDVVAIRGNQSIGLRSRTLPPAQDERKSADRFCRCFFSCFFFGVTYEKIRLDFQGMDTMVSPGHSSDYADQEDSFPQSPVRIQNWWPARQSGGVSCPSLTVAFFYFAASQQTATPQVQSVRQTIETKSKTSSSP